MIIVSTMFVFQIPIIMGNSLNFINCSYIKVSQFFIITFKFVSCMLIIVRWLPLHFVSSVRSLWSVLLLLYQITLLRYKKIYNGKSANNNKGHKCN